MLSLKKFKKLKKILIEMNNEKNIIEGIGFIIKPEYIKPGMKLIFREGKVKAIGKIINTFLNAPSIIMAEQTTNKNINENMSL